MLKLRLGELRRILKEELDCVGGTRPEESYDNELAEDDAYKKTSIMVPDDVKAPINAWMYQMGLSGGKRLRRKR